MLKRSLPDRAPQRFLGPLTELLLPPGAVHALRNRVAMLRGPDSIERYGEQAQLPDDHKARSVVQKPYTLENVARVLSELIREDA